MADNFWQEFKRLDYLQRVGIVKIPKAKKNNIMQKTYYDSLESLKQALITQEICELQKNATNLVFADGNPQSEIMIFGEAPGKTEDLQGIPFCGRSGQLLDKMLQAIDLNREKVYITNPVFWRPPDNRKPTEEEINACKSFVANHVALIKPKIILLLGATALSAILNITAPLGQTRGKIYYYENSWLKSEKIPVIVSFHPAYLLRQPQQKKFAWEDLLLLKSYIANKK